jgi:hypothetical protein
MSSVPSSRPGSGSATNSSAREVGGALGVAVMGSVAASVFVGDLRRSPGFPEDRADTVGRSLASALDHAATLPSQLVDRFADDAKSAFVAGIRASVWIPMVITAAVAARVWRGLPDPEPDELPTAADAQVRVEHRP